MVVIMKNSNNSMHPELKKLIPIADAIVSNFGENTEVVIHDSRNLESSIVYIAGDVTHRKIGAPATNLVLNGIKQNIDKKECYRTITNDGKVLRSTTTFIRDENKQIIGCICINYDISDFLHCKSAMEKLTMFPQQSIDSHDSNKHNDNEFFGSNIQSVIEKIIMETIETLSKPVEILNKDEKMQFVKHLDEKGIFEVKGSVENIAEMLGVSKYTIYNWLDKLTNK